MKFEVGDTVKVTRYWPNSTSLHTGTEGVVKVAKPTGRIEWYTVEIPGRSGGYYGRTEPQRYQISGGNLALVKKGNLPPVVHPVYKTDEASDLANKVVTIARKFAKKHDWCDVVDEALIAAGLGAYLNTTKRVKVVTEVLVTSKPGETLTDEQAVAKALAKVKAGTVESKTSVSS